MAKADYIGLTGDALLAKVFAGWEFYGFDFPKVKGDGITGKKCISKGAVQFMRRRNANGSWQGTNDDTYGLLSAHVYFKASSGEIKQSTTALTVKIKEFHLTVRRRKSQLLIDDNGPSILTSKESIHINRNTDWGRDENIDALVTALSHDTPQAPAFTRAELLDFLNDRLRWTTARMAIMATDLPEEARSRLAAETGVTIIVEGDETISGH